MPDAPPLALAVCIECSMQFLAPYLTDGCARAVDELHCPVARSHGGGVEVVVRRR